MTVSLWCAFTRVREEFLRERLKDKQHESREEKALREHDMVDKMRDLYAIPDHLKVKLKHSTQGHTDF